jgi:hypothetical protein
MTGHLCTIYFHEKIQNAITKIRKPRGVCGSRGVIV